MLEDFDESEIQENDTLEVIIKFDMNELVLLHELNFKLIENVICLNNK